MNPKNLIGSPRTTGAGALSLVLNLVVQQIIPQLAAYFGRQPGLLWTVVGTLLALLPAALMSDTKPAAPASVTNASGKVDLVLLAFLVPALALASCAFLKGSTVNATVSGKQADVAITAPDGSQYGILVANHQACVSGAPYIALPGSNIECQPACGELVTGGATVTVNCRVAGQTGVFPIQFTIPKV